VGREGVQARFRKAETFAQDEHRLARFWRGGIIRRVKPPQGLSAPGRRAWRFANATIARLGDDPAGSAQAIERYARLVDQLAVADEAWQEAGRPLTAPGSTGQAQAHPILRLMRELRTELLAHEAALGLTVGARATMSRRQGGPGVGHAADRQPARPGIVRALPTRVA
jgi:phage terminase small subunit